MKTHGSSFVAILPLFTVILIDTLSGTLLGPILPRLFVSSPESIVFPDLNPSISYFLFGFTQAIFFIATFFACPILGDLSDRIGRKKVMMISLIGAFLGYLVSVFAVLSHAISLLLIGRFIAGVTAGSISAAKAAVIDISHEKNKTAYIGYVLMAVSIGSIIGPLLSGMLSNTQWSTYLGVTTPLYMAGFLSFLNVVYLYFGFKDSYKPTNKPIDFSLGLTTFIKAFVMPSISRLSYAFLFMQFGWAIFVQFIPLFLALRFQFNSYKIGIYMSVVGIGFTLAFVYILNMLTSRFSLRQIALCSISVIFLSIFFMVTINQELTIWILAVPAATSLAIGYSVLVSLFSNAVELDQQGWVMGLTGAISAVAFGSAGLIAGLLVDINASAPLWLALISIFVSIISIYFTKHTKVSDA